MMHINYIADNNSDINYENVVCNFIPFHGLETAFSRSLMP